MTTIDQVWDQTWQQQTAKAHSCNHGNRFRRGWVFCGVHGSISQMHSSIRTWVVNSLTVSSDKEILSAGTVAVCYSSQKRSLLLGAAQELNFICSHWFQKQGAAAGLGAGSIPAIDQEPNNLVYTAAVEPDQETQEQLRYSKGLGEFKIAALSGINLFIFTRHTATQPPWKRTLSRQKFCPIDSFSSPRLLLATGSKLWTPCDLCPPTPHLAQELLCHCITVNWSLGGGRRGEQTLFTCIKRYGRWLTTDRTQALLWQESHGTIYEGFLRVCEDGGVGDK